MSTIRELFLYFDFRERLDNRQAELRQIDPTVLIENEEDLEDFPSESQYKFCKEPKFLAYEYWNGSNFLG